MNIGQFKAILAKLNFYNKYYKTNSLHQLDMVAKIMTQEVVQPCTL